MKQVLCTVLLACIILSCKKTSAPKPHVFTSNQTVDETVTASATITQNSSGTWVISGTSTISPVIDSLIMNGDIFINIHATGINGQTIDHTVTPSAQAGQPFSMDVTGITFTNPTLTNVFFEPGTSTSLGSVFYTVNYH